MSDELSSSSEKENKQSHARSHYGAGALGYSTGHSHPPPRTHVRETEVQDFARSAESVRDRSPTHQGAVPPPHPADSRAGQPEVNAGRRATTAGRRATSRLSLVDLICSKTFVLLCITGVW